MSTLKVKSGKTALLLASIAGVLTLAHLTAVWSTHRYGRDHLMYIIDMLDMDTEHSIPTLYSFFCLLGCAALLALIGHLEGRLRTGNAGYWGMLSFIFVFLAFDESFMIHEQLNTPLRDHFGVDGALHFAWVLPYGVGLLVLLGICSRFIIALPPRSRALFIAAGVIYVGGALGMEMVNGQFKSTSHSELSYDLLTTIEEVLELSGLILFIYALLSHIGRELPCTYVTVHASAPREDEHDWAHSHRPICKCGTSAQNTPEGDTP